MDGLSIPFVYNVNIWYGTTVSTNNPSGYGCKPVSVSVYVNEPWRVNGPLSNEPNFMMRMINWDWNVFYFSTQIPTPVRSPSSAICVVINSLTALRSTDTRRVMKGKQNQTVHLVCFFLNNIPAPPPALIFFWCLSEGYKSIQKDENCHAYENVLFSVEIKRRGRI